MGKIKQCLINMQIDTNSDTWIVINKWIGNKLIESEKLLFNRYTSQDDTIYQRAIHDILIELRDLPVKQEIAPIVTDTYF